MDKEFMLTALGYPMLSMLLGVILMKVLIIKALWIKKPAVC